ncbi:MAG TPA: diguanylate cyclase [Microbacterium sp.]|nr:diguanylate cyclase [Microbacterium sp.]
MTDSEYEKRYRQAPCGLLSTDISGVVLEANDTFLDWIGYPADRVIGSAFTRLLDAGSQLFFETRHTQALHLRGSVREVALRLKRADGSVLPVLVNSELRRDEQPAVVRTAVFDTTDRLRYETDLLQARKAAESSEERVRLLQDVSSVFEGSATDEEVAESFAALCREAFAATETAVLLRDGTGGMRVVGGANPLAGTVPPIASLRNTTDVIAVHADDAEPEFPVLAAGLREARLESLSIAPLMNDGESLGVLVCFFRRHREFDERSFDLKRALGRQAAQTLVRIRLQRRLEHLALYDQLTGVANRQLLQQSLDAAIGISARANEPLALVFLDLDEFKSINDRWGHAAGDTVLREVASRLREAVRAGDIVGRIGGDEFVAICANSDPHDGESIAERILAVTHEPILLQGVAITVAVSAGIATYRPGTDPRPTGDQLLIRADAAMYSSKTAGKGRVTLEPRPVG